MFRISPVEVSPRSIILPAANAPRNGDPEEPQSAGKRPIGPAEVLPVAPPIPERKDEYIRRLNERIEKFEKDSSRKFEDDLKVFAKKNPDGSYVLPEKQADAIKAVISDALGIPEGYKLKLTPNKDGDARGEGLIEGYIVGKSEQSISFSFSRNTGKVVIGNLPISARDVATSMPLLELNTLSFVHSTALYYWNEGIEEKNAPSKEQKQKILSQINAALDLEVGTITDVKKLPTARGDTKFTLLSKDKTFATFTARRRNGFTESLDLEKPESPKR